MNLRVHVEAESLLPYEDLPPVDAHFQSRARREGYEFDAVAMEHLAHAGASAVEGRHTRHRYAVDGLVRTANGRQFLVLAHGNLGDASSQPGLVRPDTVAKVVERVVMLRFHGEPPVVVVTSHLPRPMSVGAHHLADLHRLVGAEGLIDIVATTGDFLGFRRLQRYCTAEPRPVEPLPAPWWDPSHRPTLLDLADSLTPM